MNYVLGIDLGTSAVKILLLNQNGEICDEISKPYPLIQEKSGYSEQDPLQWVDRTTEALSEIVAQFDGEVQDIEGISFSGQMHGLVLLDQNHQLVRNAILWNDTRTTDQCRQIYQAIGKERLLDITKNPALEGFTLPKLLWVKENEPDLYEKAAVFMLPKDYLRYRMTGKIHSEYSDAAGTLLLDINQKEWSKEICHHFELKEDFCPELVESHAFVGTLNEEFAKKTGLSSSTKVFAGGADNACGAIGAGILTEGKTLCSIGTSGVILSYEQGGDRNFQGKVHYFNHGKENAYYSMGVTLAAGYSLSWFKDVFAENESFEELLEEVKDVPIGANGLLFTPYIVGERTPHADSAVRGSFIGIDAAHTKKDFSRAVIEGITFSLNESIEIFRENGMEVDTIISIGGGAKNKEWLQIQADVFNAEIVKLTNEQGPGMGAAMLAAYGCEWFPTLQECADQFIRKGKTFFPNKDDAEKYQKIYRLYKSVYQQTKELNEGLKEFRQ
ncbi:xylulokinase [Metabacillus arenae]|uniref:Xylulose kinase n=1 Tax=Metabacillus arenae TaxID=2771434 RepID=A0A926NIQ5_9BACI|nr:xylulokinase [Metabacillus arenae]MBD1381495.1 xylulokinase [Metabacillus arenae]